MTFKLGLVVTAINTETKTVELGNGETLGFTKLALCTGARARPLPIPGADLQGVHYLRTMDDVKGIRQSAASAKTAVIIGGGYIGLETAASLSKLGVAVTVLETESRLLQRVASPSHFGFLSASASGTRRDHKIRNSSLSYRQVKDRSLRGCLRRRPDGQWGYGNYRHWCYCQYGVGLGRRT